MVATSIDPSTEWGEHNMNKIIPDMYDVGGALSSYERPRLIKNHEKFDKKYPKVVYLYRDGRDVLVSYFNYYKKVKSYEGKFGDFFEMYLNGSVNFGRWDKHVIQWVESNHEDIIYTKYEDLCTNTKEELLRIMDFLGKGDIPEDVIHLAAERCTFERHKENVRQHSEHYEKGYEGGVKGGPGKWREVFSKQQLIDFWSEMGGTMERVGYSRRLGSLE